VSHPFSRNNPGRIGFDAVHGIALRTSKPTLSGISPSKRACCYYLRALGSFGARITQHFALKGVSKNIEHLDLWLTSRPASRADRFLPP
jgi:hypothetical protein